MADHPDPHAAAADPHADDGNVGEHEQPTDHGGDHGHDDHGHDAGEALGPVDVPAWGAAVLGIVLGLVVVAAFILAAT